MFFFLVVRRVPPRFSIPPTNHEVMPGGSVNLTCVAVGAPMPYVKWMAGEVELTKDDEMPVGRNVLELTNIRQSTNYTCVAISSLGMIEATAQVSVKGKIPEKLYGKFQLYLIFHVPLRLVAHWVCKPLKVRSSTCVQLTVVEICFWELESFANALLPAHKDFNLKWYSIDWPRAGAD